MAALKKTNRKTDARAAKLPLPTLFDVSLAMEAGLATTHAKRYARPPSKSAAAAFAAFVLASSVGPDESKDSHERLADMKDTVQHRCRNQVIARRLGDYVDHLGKKLSTRDRLRAELLKRTEDRLTDTRASIDDRVTHLIGEARRMLAQDETLYDEPALQTVFQELLAMQHMTRCCPDSEWKHGLQARFDSFYAEVNT